LEAEQFPLALEAEVETVKGPGACPAWGDHEMGRTAEPLVKKPGSAISAPASTQPAMWRIRWRAARVDISQVTALAPLMVSYRPLYTNHGECAKSRFTESPA